MRLALTAGPDALPDDALWCVERLHELRVLSVVRYDAPHLGPVLRDWSAASGVPVEVGSPATGWPAVVLPGGDGLRCRALGLRCTEVAAGERPWWGVQEG